MPTIHKYPLEFLENTVQMPEGAQILSAGMDPRGQLCCWAKVDPERPKQPRKILALFTGMSFTEEIGVTPVFIGTVVADQLVIHVLDATPCR